MRSPPKSLPTWLTWPRSSLSPEEAEYLRRQLNNQLKAIHELEAIPLDESLPVTSHGVPYTAAISPAAARRRVAALPEPGRNPGPGAASRRWLHHRPRHPPHQTGLDPWNSAIFLLSNSCNCCAPRKVSAVEVLESALERIAAVDGRPGTPGCGALTEEDQRKVHAFITLTAERARTRLEAVDRKLAAGEDPGPAGGRALHRQGYLLRRGHAFHGCLAHPGQFHRALHRHTGGTHGSRRRR